MKKRTRKIKTQLIMLAASFSITASATKDDYGKTSSLFSSRLSTGIW
jgi:hypothetical protein